MKVLIYNDDGSAFVCDADPQVYVSKHLQLGEVSNPSCNKTIKYVQTKESRTALKCWEYVRERYGKPITISRNYTEKDYNASIKGASPTSLHLGGLAFDCQFPNMSDALYNNFCHWSEIAGAMYGVQVEIIREPYGVHLGFGKLPYTTKSVYIYDNRK